MGNASLVVVCERTQLKRYPNSRIIIASSTVDKAKQLCWGLLYTVNRRLKLGWQFLTGSSMIKTINGDIFFRGLRDLTSANLDKGFQSPLVICDEPQLVRTHILKHYIQNIVDFTFVGVEHPRICFSLNPPHYRHAYLEFLYNNPEVLKIKTDMWENPAYNLSLIHI